MPKAAAFFATSPAATITEGLEVFVQLVMAAIKTLPFFISPLGVETDSHGFLPEVSKRSENLAFTSARDILSCGRFGPATHGFTSESSNSTTLE